MQFGKMVCRVDSVAMSVVFMCLAGCANARQEQLFAVTYRDPDTGKIDRNYYRMTVEGGTLGALTYQLKAAYMNSATVDVLQGKGVFVPEADLTVEQDEVFDEVLNIYYTTVQKRAEIAAEIATDPSREAISSDDSLVQVARQVWLTRLSTGDVASMGQVQSTDPLEFRKLVFYATAKNIDLEQTIGPQIDSIISHVTTLARHEKQKAKARKNRKQAITNMVRNLPIADPNARGLIESVISVIDGTADSSASTPSGGN